MGFREEGSDEVPAQKNQQTRIVRRETRKCVATRFHRRMGLGILGAEASQLRLLSISFLKESVEDDCKRGCAISSCGFCSDRKGNKSED
jgi:hypothetical protein